MKDYTLIVEVYVNYELNEIIHLSLSSYCTDGEHFVEYYGKELYLQTTLPFIISLKMCWTDSEGNNIQATIHSIDRNYIKNIYYTDIPI
jgi:hypothetical protein